MITSNFDFYYKYVKYCLTLPKVPLPSTLRNSKFSNVWQVKIGLATWWIDISEVKINRKYLDYSTMIIVQYKGLQRGGIHRNLETSCWLTFDNISLGVLGGFVDTRKPLVSLHFLINNKHIFKFDLSLRFWSIGSAWKMQFLIDVCPCHPWW